MANKARHAFGSEANVDTALEAGTIDAYDILFLDEKKIGWIDKNGQKVIIEDAEQVSVVTALPETGKDGVLYIVVNAADPTSITASGYVWSNEKFIPVFDGTTSGDGIDEATIDNKIEEALSIVEF